MNELQDYGLDDVISAVYTPPPRHQSSSVRQPPSPLDDDVICGCPLCVMNDNWSATKQGLHLQSVADISRHSVLSGDRIRQCETSSGSHHKDRHRHISVCKSPFPSAGTAVSLFCAKTVQQRPLLPMEVKTQLPDCGGAH